MVDLDHTSHLLAFTNTSSPYRLPPATLSSIRLTLLKENPQNFFLFYCENFVPHPSLSDIDHKAFAKDVEDLHKRLKENIGEDDKKHFFKMGWWSRVLTLVGYATLWIAINPSQFCS